MACNMHLHIGSIVGISWTLGPRKLWPGLCWVRRTGRRRGTSCCCRRWRERGCMHAWQSRRKGSRDRISNYSSHILITKGRTVFAVDGSYFGTSITCLQSLVFSYFVSSSVLQFIPLQTILTCYICVRFQPATQAEVSSSNTRSDVTEVQNPSHQDIPSR